ncbi:hypothetical protein BASA61_007833 [Batrachochytrium salamandrivorans]|nr:hypothetical protein BASA61_007833 [Batrachochytrium salamandrivorans]
MLRNSPAAAAAHKKTLKSNADRDPPSRQRDSAVDLSPIIEPHKGMMVVAWSLVWVTALFAVGLYLVACGMGLNKVVSYKSDGYSDGTPIGTTLTPPPPLTPSFKRLLVVTFDDNPLLMHSLGLHSTTKGSIASFESLSSVIESQHSTHGLLFSTDLVPMHGPRDAAVSAMTGVHARLQESLLRIVLPAFVQDSVLSRIVTTAAASTENKEEEEQDEQDEQDKNNKDNQDNQDNQDLPFNTYPAECLGQSFWESTVFFGGCKATHTVQRVLHLLRTGSFGLLSVHLSLRDLQEQQSSVLLQQSQKTGIDGFLNTVLPLIDAQTLAVVISPSGSHVLFHSSRLSLDSDSPTVTADQLAALASQITRSDDSKTTNDDDDRSAKTRDDLHTIDIEDVTPSLAALYGIPIPSSNEGIAIPELLLRSRVGDSSNARLAALQAALRDNAEQLRLLANTTSSISTDDASSNLLALAQAAALNYNPTDHSTIQEMLVQCRLDYSISKSLSALVQRSYTNTNGGASIVFGAVILMGATAVTLLQIIAHLNQVPRLPDEIALISVTIGSLSGFFGLLTWALDTVGWAQSIVIDPFHEGMFLGAMLLIITVILLKVKETLFPDPLAAVPLSSAPKLPFSFLSFNCGVALITFAFLVISPFVHLLDIGLSERDAVLYGMQAFALLFFLNAFFVTDLQHRDALVKTTLLLIVLIRLGLVFDIQTSPLFSSNDQINTLVVPTAIASINFVLAALLAYVVRRTIDSSDNLHSTGAVVGGILVPFGLFISAVYWMLETLHIFPGVMALSIGDTINFVQYWTAKLGFMSTSITSLYVWGTDPNCVGMEVLDNSSNNSSNSGKNLPKSAQVFTPEEAKSKKTAGKTLCFMGIANGIGTSYLSFFLAIYMGLNHLQTSVGSAVLTISVLQICGLIEIYHLWRDKAEVMSWWSSCRSGPSSSTGSAKDTKSGRSVPLRSGASMTPTKKKTATTTTTAAAASSTLSDADKERSFALRAVFADPYLTAAFIFVTALLTRYIAIASSQTPSFALLAQQLPSEASLGFGGIKMTRSNMAKSSLTLWAETIASCMVLIWRVYGPNIIIGSLTPALFVLWKRPLLRGGETRLICELSFAMAVKFGLVSGVFLLGEVFALFLAASATTTTTTPLSPTFNASSSSSSGLPVWDIQVQIFTVRAFGCLVEGLVALISMVAVLMAISGYAGFQRKMKRLGVLE